LNYPRARDGVLAIEGALRAGALITSGAKWKLNCSLAKAALPDLPTARLIINTYRGGQFSDFVLRTGKSNSGVILAAVQLSERSEVAGVVLSPTSSGASPRRDECYTAFPMVIDVMADHRSARLVPGKEVVVSGYRFISPVCEDRQQWVCSEVSKSNCYVLIEKIQH